MTARHDKQIESISGDIGDIKVVLNNLMTNVGDITNAILTFKSQSNDAQEKLRSELNKEQLMMRQQVGNSLNEMRNQTATEIASKTVESNNALA